MRKPAAMEVISFRCLRGAIEAEQYLASFDEVTVFRCLRGAIEAGTTQPA